MYSTPKMLIARENYTDISALFQFFLRPKKFIFILLNAKLTSGKDLPYQQV